MNNLHLFYKEVLSELDFSIIGYRDLESKLMQFFKKTTDSNWLAEQQNIDCISYSYSLLKDFPFLIDSITTKSFFFNSFNERSYEEFIVSDYAYFRQLLKDVLKSDIKTSENFANLFNKHPPSFRVSVCDQAYISVVYEQHLDLISIVIPFTSYFKQNKFKKHTPESIKLKIYNKYNTLVTKDYANTEILKGVKKNGNSYDLESVKDYKTNLSFNQDLNIFELIKTSQILEAKIDLLNKSNDNYFFNHKGGEGKESLKRFTLTILAHGFFAFMYDTWMENIPSIIFVDETDNIKRSLGTFIVGYSKQNELDNNQRTQFRILSDRISSTLAGNVAFDIYKKKTTPNLLEETSKCYGIKGIKEITHGGSSYYPIEKTLENAIEQVKHLKKVFEILEFSNKDLKGIDEIKKNNNEVLEELNSLKNYEATINDKIQIIRNSLEVKCEKIKTSIENLDKDKLEFIKFDCSQLSAFVNPIDILKDGIKEMLKLFFLKDKDKDKDKDKGLGLDKCYFTIYSKEETEYPIEGISNKIKQMDNYIIFMHADSIKIDKNKIPNWLENMLKKNIRFVGEFFYSYTDNGTRKYFDINLNEVDSGTLVALKEIGTKLTEILTEAKASIWYIINFKTFKQ